MRLDLLWSKLNLALMSVALTTMMKSNKNKSKSKNNNQNKKSKNNKR